jgi:hypothetical protein
MDPVQMKITVPSHVFASLVGKAIKSGITPSEYVTHLILKDVERMDVPTFEVTKKVEAAYTQARQADEKGELVTVHSISDFFTNL